MRQNNGGSDKTVVSVKINNKAKVKTHDESTPSPATRPLRPALVIHDNRIQPGIRAREYHY
jgi:hypothetical protein